jgi:hypothetical protein
VELLELAHVPALLRAAAAPIRGNGVVDMSSRLGAVSIGGVPRRPHFLAEIATGLR